MLIDYYEVLDVQPDVSPDQLRQAYRQAAMRNHPDRGGTDEKMKAVNLAFEILTNPQQRADYDRLRACGPSLATHAEAEWVNRTQDLRQKASEYPKQWSEFEKWMEAFASDIQATKLYTEDENQTASSVFFGVCGVALTFAFCFASGLYPNFATWARGSSRSLHVMFELLIFPVMPMVLGYHCGWVALLLLKKHLKNKTHGGTSTDPATQQRETSYQRPSPSLGGSLPPQSLPAPDIVQCGVCGKKLRVPHLGKDLSITCPACKNKFAYRSPF